MKNTIFAMNKLIKRKVEALQAGTLLPSEVDDELHAAAAEEAQKIEKRGKELEAKRRRHVVFTKVKTVPGCSALGGEPIYVEPSVMQFDLKKRLAPMVCVNDVCKAKHVVLANVTAIGQRAKWVVNLLGGWIFSVEAALGREGAALKYKCALDICRRVWISQAFSESHPIIRNIVDHALATKAGHRWKLLADKAAFVGAKNEAIAKKHSATVIALLTAEECHDADLEVVKKHLSMPSMHSIS